MPLSSLLEGEFFNTYIKSGRLFQLADKFAFPESSKIRVFR